MASYIVDRQQKFIDHGASELQSITLREVAESLELHESTISRITTGKYIATPQGIFELKYFFPSHVKTTTGQSKSSTAVKKIIKELVESEVSGQVYSDEDLTRLLKERGIAVSRRTVAKYRESMDIPSSYMRQSVHEFVDDKALFILHFFKGFIIQNNDFDTTIRGFFCRLGSFKFINVSDPDYAYDFLWDHAKMHKLSTCRISAIRR